MDLLLVMTVNPGFGGQAYIPTMEPKVAEARRLIDVTGHDVTIEVDGGVSARTAPSARRAGAERFVAGSAILQHPGGKRAGVEDLREVLGQGRTLIPGSRPGSSAPP